MVLHIWTTPSPVQLFFQEAFQLVPVNMWAMHYLILKA